MHKARVCPTAFGATFTAWFVWNDRLKEFPLSTNANHFELRCQSKVTLGIVFQNWFLLMPDLFLEHAMTAKSYCYVFILYLYVIRIFSESYNILDLQLFLFVHNLLSASYLAVPAIV